MKSNVYHYTNAYIQNKIPMWIFKDKNIDNRSQPLHLAENSKIKPILTNDNNILLNSWWAVNFDHVKIKTEKNTSEWNVHRIKSFNTTPIRL